MKRLHSVKRQQLALKYPILVTLSLVLLLLWALPAAAGDDNGHTEKRVKPPAPGSIEDSYAYIAELALAPAQNVSLDMQRLTPIITYLRHHQESGRDLHPLPEVASMPGAFHSFRIERPLEAVLAYAYNPDIPQVAFRPTSIRLTYWSDINGRHKAAFPHLWPLLTKLDSPYQLQGKEVTEITPDLFSGAYFRYTLDTRIILMRYQGQRLFLSISRQPEKSDVGKKGAIVGGDHSWNYLYASSSGLVKPGLGWVKSYIYDSLSVVIYLESEADKDRVEVGIFKWLNAGWAGINMVKPKHIHEGLLRFADPFKQLLERADLPAPKWLATYFRPLGEMSLEDLRDRARRYHRRLQRRFADQYPFNNTKLSKLFGDPAYADGLDRIEMEAMLAKDYAKPIFGMQSLLNSPLEAGGDDPSDRVPDANIKLP
jgi:hypothetical protein